MVRWLLRLRTELDRRRRARRIRRLLASPRDFGGSGTAEVRAARDSR
jgi:hypothetical protein